MIFYSRENQSMIVHCDNKTSLLWWLRLEDLKKKTLLQTGRQCFDWLPVYSCPFLTKTPDCTSMSIWLLRPETGVSRSWSLKRDSDTLTKVWRDSSQLARGVLSNPLWNKFRWGGVCVVKENGWLNTLSVQKGHFKIPVIQNKSQVRGP